MTKVEPVVPFTVSKKAEGVTPNASAFERSNFVTRYVPVKIVGSRIADNAESFLAAARTLLPTLLRAGKPRLLMSSISMAKPPVEPNPGIAGGFAGNAVTPGIFWKRV